MAHEMPQVNGVRHRFVTAGGMNFHVAEAGEGDPVLLLHGWPQHWYCWRLVMPALAKRYRVLAMDLRGFGWSDIAWEGFDKQNMAADVERVLAELEIDRARIVGHDWGAWLGYLLAMRRPELVQQLVALSSPPPFVQRGPRVVASGWRLAYMPLIASPLGVRLMRRPSFIAGVVRRGSRRRQHLRKEVMRLYGRDLRASTRARAATMLYRTFLKNELRPVITGRYRRERLDVPTLIMHGKQDPALRPALYEGLEEHGDRITVEPVRKVGHYLPEEAPELVTERILEFFSAPAAESDPALVAERS